MQKTFIYIVKCTEDNKIHAAFTSLKKATLYVKIEVQKRLKKAKPLSKGYIKQSLQILQIPLNPDYD